MGQSATFFGDPQQQAALERIKLAYPEIDFNNQDIFPYTIVTEMIMSAANSYEFFINQKSMPTSTLPLCKGLLDSDLFFGYDLAMTVDARVSTKPSSVLRYQFGNPDVFNTASNTGIASDIETFYNALLSLTISNVEKIQGWSTTDFLKVPFAAPAIVATPPAAGTANTVPNTNNYARELKYVPTTIVALMGGDQNSWKITLTTGSTAPSITNTATNGQNVIALIQRGFRIPNGANAYRAVVGSK